MDDEASMVDRLRKRDALRLETIEKRHRLKDDVDAGNEGVDYFWSAFGEMTDEIESALAAVESAPRSDSAVLFEAIGRDLKRLQKYASDSSIFLKDYNVRKSAAVIQNLQTKRAELESRLFPKKKFGFSNKKSAKKSVDARSTDDVDRAVEPIRKSWDAVACGFRNVSGERLSLSGEAVSKRDVSLSDLSDCVVTVEGCPATLHLDNLARCVILCGPVATSVFLDKCVDCKMAFACQQLRCHSSFDCDIYLHVTSRGIVEDCRAIRVAPYNFRYERVDEDFSTAGLDRSVNNWNRLDDFNWLSADVASPNWSILDENLRVSSWNL